MVHDFARESNVVQLQERMLPQNLDAEIAVLGGCLIDPNAISRVVDALPAEAFYQSAHREIYRAMLVLHGNDQTVDLMSVYSWLVDRGLLEKVGGKKKLVELVDRSVSAVNIDQYGELIVDKYKRRLLIQVGNEIASMGADTETALPELFDKAEQSLFGTTQGNTASTVFSVQDIVLPVYQDIENRFEGVTPPGISCGFYDLDAMTQGFQRSDLIIEAGRPSMGKTAFALNIAHNVSAFHNQSTLIFSLEMSKERLVQRLLSSESRIESGRLLAGRVAQNEWELLGGAVAKVSGLPMFIDDTPAATVAHMKSKARRLQAEQGQLGLIMIDYLQLMGGVDSNRVQELSKITRSLKTLARELNVPVIALSQLSRGVESRTNKRPMMSDLRESGAIEQDADLIMMLYRDEYYNPDTPDRGIAEVIIAKARNGPTGTVKLLFENQFTQFRNLAGPRRTA